MPDKKTLFISRAGADKRWAELIASVERDAGHEPLFQAENFEVGQSIPANMMRGAEADCTIAVFSPDYFKSGFCLAELNAARIKDPLRRNGWLIPVRVEPVEIPSLVAQLAYLGLVGATAATARQRLTFNVTIAAQSLRAQRKAVA
jgi:TIR domain